MTRSACRVLVLSRKAGTAAAVAQGLDQGALADICEQVLTAVEWATSSCAALSGYDAVLCPGDRPEELSLVVRLRKQDPDTPIILVSGRADHPEFRAMVRRLGATTVLSSASPPEAAGRVLLRAAEARAMARSLRSNAERSSRLAREVRALVDRQWLLSETSRRLLRPSPEGG